MRILAFSDLHRDVKAAKKIVDASQRADVVVGAGDFATQGQGGKETLSILAKCQVPVIVVHGNHDAPDELAAMASAHASLIHLHGQSVIIGGKVFFGLGGEIPARNTFDWNCAETEERATHFLRDMPVGAILVTHTPPFGIADTQKNGVHEGSTAIRQAICDHAPPLVLCGHIHNAWGQTGQLGKTHIHNLGPTANWFER